MFQRARSFIASSGLALLVAVITFATFAFGQDNADEPSVDHAPKAGSSTRLREIISHLSERIGERNLSRPKKLNETVTYVQKMLESMGYSIDRQSFSVSGIECHNLIAEVVGSVSPKEIVLICAHYDSARGTPGANDNGTAWRH